MFEGYKSVVQGWGVFSYPDDQQRWAIDVYHSCGAKTLLSEAIDKKQCASCTQKIPNHVHDALLLMSKSTGGKV